ncbi:GNAT family N-acetyltransferase [Flagellimonas olearia]|uniref:GNAT family N-acetyltransferase n=1 Tax=Flagellimonas olearia TaxID=552546 RepID=A0A6I1E1I9_9FLAO|nr:GNAT family N-acetyltransferase [Allomuricauda olearia]KAB7530482.1 GNAT family N-acetyltransferase [Allomuricauda olearia]
MNPFVQKEFTSKWVKFFSNNRKPYHFDFLSPVPFVRSKARYIFYNVGRNITNGLTYKLNEKFQDYRKKVFLLYDVISYQEESGNSLPKGIGIKKVRQYKGYLTRLSRYTDFDDFFLSHYSSSSRMKLRKNERKLNTNFSVDYKIVYGEIDKDSYHELMDRLFELIDHRFKTLRIDNDIINKKEYYRELFYDMILAKKAIIHMICHNDLPIAISLSFISGDTLLYAINTFDTRYRRYNLGHLAIVNMVKWCFANNMQILDHSKGTYDYKLRWANESYFFENHILYDRHSMKCRMTATMMAKYFTFKQQLRNKKINETYVKLRFKLNPKRNAVKDGENIKLVDLKEKSINDNDYDILSNKEVHKLDIASVVYDLIYSNPQSMDNVKVLKRKENCWEYIVLAKGIRKKIMRTV